MRSTLKPAASRLLGRFKKKKKMKRAMGKSIAEAAMAKQGVEEEDGFGEVFYLLLFIEVVD